jgi:hypothetical protein
MAVSLSAAEGGFSATLSAEQKNSTGLTSLTSAEREALDQLVAAEVGQARQENSSGFDGTFASRRTDEERKQAGLDRLTPAQLTKLNRLVAAAMAASPKPKERPRIKDSDVFSAPIKPEVHGEISLTYGRGSGGSDFRAASMWVDYFDPNTGFGLSVGISNFKGNGFYGFYPGYYGPSSFYGPGFGYYGSPYRNFGRDEWDVGDGQSFRTYGDWNSPYYREFHR